MLRLYVFLLLSTHVFTLRPTLPRRSAVASASAWAVSAATLSPARPPAFAEPLDANGRPIGRTSTSGESYSRSPGGARRIDAAGRDFAESKELNKEFYSDKGGEKITVEAKIPLGAKLGDEFEVKLPDGSVRLVPVPPGIPPGSTLKLKIELPPTSSSSAASTRPAMPSPPPSPRERRPSSPPPRPPPAAPAAPTRQGNAADFASLGSQSYNEVNVNEAKEKFARIALEEIARKEAKLGFELDNEAKSAIVQLLRSRYCGKDGLIGPC